MEELVLGKMVKCNGGGECVITKVKTFDGDATVVLVRGKNRHGFDFDATFEWEATFPGVPSAKKKKTKKPKPPPLDAEEEEEKKKEEEEEEEEEEEPAPIVVKGTMRVPEASRDTVEDDEVEYEVKVKDRKTEHRSLEDAAYAALKTPALRAFYHDTFATIDKELLARANL